MRSGFDPTTRVAPVFGVWHRAGASESGPRPHPATRPSVPPTTPGAAIGPPPSERPRPADEWRKENPKTIRKRPDTVRRTRARSCRPDSTEKKTNAKTIGPPENPKPLPEAEEPGC